MCISSYVKYLIVSVMIGALVILSIFTENLFYALPVMVLAIVQSRIPCPKCHEPILKDKNGWYIFTIRTTCRHCGQDTLLCEVESDEATKARLK